MKVSLKQSMQVLYQGRVLPYRCHLENPVEARETESLLLVASKPARQ